MIGAYAFGEAGEVVAPGGGGILHLIVHGEEGGLDVDAGRCVGLADVELEAFWASQGDEGDVLGRMRRRAS